MLDEWLRRHGADRFRADRFQADRFKIVIQWHLASTSVLRLGQSRQQLLLELFLKYQFMTQQFGIPLGRQLAFEGAAQQALVNDAFPSYNFDVIDGVTYEIDVTQPARYAINGQLANPNAQRIRNLSFGGKPIDPQARFIVATNNYRAYGGGNFPGVTGAKVVLDAPDENRQALVDYLSQSAVSKINPSADGNWRIAPTGTVEATFLSSSNAARFLAQHPGIRLVKDNGDGSAVYGLKP